ncbi:MAG: FIG00801922: hypothetical protein, partial [uncultured Craurococcus sp.]
EPGRRDAAGDQPLQPRRAEHRGADAGHSRCRGLGRLHLHLRGADQAGPGAAQRLGHHHAREGGGAGGAAGHPLHRHADQCGRDGRAGARPDLQRHRHWDSLRRARGRAVGGGPGRGRRGHRRPFWPSGAAGDGAAAGRAVRGRHRPAGRAVRAPAGRGCLARPHLLCRAGPLRLAAVPGGPGLYEALGAGRAAPSRPRAGGAHPGRMCGDDGLRGARHHGFRHRILALV